MLMTLIKPFIVSNAELVILKISNSQSGVSFIFTRASCQVVQLGFSLSS